MHQSTLMKPKQRETHQRHKKDSELMSGRTSKLRTDSYSRLETAWCGTFSKHKIGGSSGGVFPFGRELNQRESALGWIWKMGTYTKAASAIWVPWIHNTMPLTSKPQASGFSTFETRKKDCVGVAIGCQRMMER